MMTASIFHINTKKIVLYTQEHMTMIRLLDGTKQLSEDDKKFLEH